MRRMMGMMLVAALLIGLGSNWAYAEDCTGVYVNVRQQAAYKAHGACYNAPVTAQDSARKLCEKSANDPRDCEAGTMTFEGKGLDAFSVCFGDEFIAVACVLRDGRLYCQRGCGDSQEMANFAAIDGCKKLISYYKGCKLQDIQ